MDFIVFIFFLDGNYEGEGEERNSISDDEQEDEEIEATDDSQYLESLSE